MLKRWSFWIPIGVATVITIVLALLTGTLFGGEVGVMIQAASTVYLVAVTVSYVVATFEVSKFAERQLQLQEREPIVNAIEAVWRGARRVTEPALALNVKAALLVKAAVAGTNSAPALQTELRQYADALREFPALTADHHLRLPKDVRLAADKAAWHANTSAAMADALLDAVGQEIIDAINDQRQKDVERISARWRTALGHRLADNSIPSWDRYIDSPDWTLATALAFGNLEEVTLRYMPSPALPPAGTPKPRA